jgi:hypothetical protein
VSSLLWIPAVALIALGVALFTSSGSPRGLHPRVRALLSGGGVRSWVTDVIVGWFIGSAVLAMLGESILAGAGSDSDTMTRVVFVILGGVLGVAFMRLVRVREAAMVDARRRRGPRDPDRPR